jgi:hypothetical protein
VRLRAGLCAVCGLAALAGCAADPPGETPRARPPGLDAPTTYEPSADSAALSRHYTRLQAHLRAQGLLRTGGGGVDTPYTAEDVARNFERIAFYDEYVRGGGLRASDGRPGGLRRWAQPVRMRLEFGRRVPRAVREADAASVAAYASRLSEVTGHPVGMAERDANFHVIVASEDDRARTVARVRELAPGLGPATMGLVENPPRSIYCMVLSFTGGDSPDVYTRAIALIRSEQPELMRRSCIHEELAQGLGLGNDSDRARPSIFNDDEEFALLTTHDEELLRLLYHPALKPGMRLQEARPVIRRILAGDPGRT